MRQFSREQIAMQAQSELDLTLSVFERMRDEAYKALESPQITRDESFDISARLIVLKAVETSLKGYVLTHKAQVELENTKTSQN